MTPSMSRSAQLLSVLAPAADSVPPTRVASTSQVPGQPSAASTMAGTVVTRSSSMIRGLVSATYDLTRSTGPDRVAAGSLTTMRLGRSGEQPSPPAYRPHHRRWPSPHSMGDAYSRTLGTLLAVRSWTIVAAVFALAACSAGAGNTDGTDASTGSDTAPLVIVANAPGTLGPGPQRMVLGLAARDASSLASPDLSVAFQISDSEGDVVAEADGVFQWTIPDVRGVYTIRPEFDGAGVYGIQAFPAESEPSVKVNFTVSDDPVVPEVGDPAIAAPSPTGDEAPLETITTDPDPDPTFYEVSLDEALGSGQPTVVVFATPAFCQSQTCGPMLDQVKAAAPEHPRGQLHPRRGLRGLPGRHERRGAEPGAGGGRLGAAQRALALLRRRRGMVTARYEGTVSPEELDEGFATVDT